MRFYRIWYRRPYVVIQVILSIVERLKKIYLSLFSYIVTQIIIYLSNQRYMLPKMGSVWYSKLLLDIEVINAIHIVVMLQLFEALTVILEECGNRKSPVSSMWCHS